MKLKLETQDAVSVLVVTEEVTAQQASVLKAGLGKLIDSGKTQFVIDLTALQAAHLKDPVALRELSALPGWAIEKNVQVMIAANLPGLGQAPSRAEAIALLQSPSAGLLARESFLRSRKQSLESQKAQLEKQLGAMPAANDPKVIQRESTQLKRGLQAIRAEMLALLQGPDPSVPTASLPDPFTSEAMLARQKTLHKIMVTVLTQQGVLGK